MELLADHRDIVQDLLRGHRAKLRLRDLLLLGVIPFGVLGKLDRLWLVSACLDTRESLSQTRTELFWILFLYRLPLVGVPIKYGDD